MDDRRTVEPYAEAIEMNSDELIAKLEAELPKAPPKGRRFRVTVEEIDEDYDAWFRRKVEAGLRDVKAGRLVPHREVEAWIRSWGTKNEMPMPKAAVHRAKSSGPKKR
jgi:predicted transcriptional regulator